MTMTTAMTTAVFRPHSHDAADQLDLALIASAQGMRALKISLAGLAVTAAAQLAVMLVSGSVALLADTIHNFGDALTAIPIGIAFMAGRRPANRRSSATGTRWPTTQWPCCAPRPVAIPTTGGSRT